MSKTANNGSIEGYTPLADPEVIAKFTYNERQKAGRLVRSITHKFDYGVSIMAQGLLKVEALQRDLAELGLPPVELEKVDFTDRSKLEEYAARSAYRQ